MDNETLLGYWNLESLAASFQLPTESSPHGGGMCIWTFKGKMEVLVEKK